MSATITYPATDNMFNDTEKITLDKILQVLNGGGTSGSLYKQQVYIGRDPAAPDDATKPALSFPSGGGTLTQWDVASQTWV